MKPRNLLLLGLMVIVLPSCQSGRQDAERLGTVERTRDPGKVVQQAITCTDVSEVCGRLYEEHGGACLDLTESAEPFNREAMRRCAVADFRQALTHLPPAVERLVATRGLAEAIRISRDNSADRDVRASNSTELASLASQLQAMPGGAPYGAYYASNVDLNRVLTRSVPPDAACPSLNDAQARLPAKGVPADLVRKLNDLRQQLSQARNRSCG